MLSISSNYGCLGLFCWWVGPQTVKSFMNSSWFYCIYCSLIAGTLVRNQAAAVSHKHSQPHNCVQFWLFPKKQEAAAKLPACFEPLNMSAAAIPQMAGGEGWEGQLFNPLQCKHDPFEWQGISQDILVWADLPKQPQTTVALCLSFRGKSFRYESSRSVRVCPKAKVRGNFSFVKCDVVFMRAQHWHDPHAVYIS